MPGIEELDRFKTTFRSIGDEAAALARRGERIEDLPLPDGRLDEDLASLLDAAAPEGAENAEEAVPEETGSGEADGFDFGAFLDSIPDELPPENAEPPEAAASDEAETVDEDEPTIPEDLLAGFAEDIEAAAAENGEPFEAAGEEPLPAAEEPLAVDDGASFDIPDLGGIGEEDYSIPSFDEPAEAAAFGESAFGESASEEGAAEAAAPEEEDAFSLFAEEAPEIPAAAEEAPPAEEEADFSIPDFDLGGEAPAEAPAETPGETPAEEELAAGFELPGKAPSIDDFGSGEDAGDEAAEAPLDSFDTFSLDDDFLASGFGVQEEKKPGKTADDGFAMLEDFSLEGIDDVFKTPAASAAAPTGRKGREAVSAAAEVEEISLSDDDFAALQNTLSAYPLNLRIACEELIAEHAVPPDQMAALVKLLIKGAGAKETAALAGRLIGRPIVIPKGFEKSSGAELESRKSTFGYIFVHTILPLLRIFLFAGLTAASLAYLGIEFVYKPLTAHSLYKQGYERIGAGDYDRGNERFDQAGKVRRVKKWYFEYARLFIEKRQYLLAEQKYDQLLAAYRRDKTGALEYAAFESRTLRNYEKADRILREEILDHSLDDKDALLALGDNNLEWGSIDPSRYEEARKAYARLMGKYGRQDEYLERMLRYLVRTDQLAETLPLQEYFLSSKKRKITADTLAELGGYFLDKKLAVPEGIPDPNIERIDNIRELLQEAVRRDARNPEAHYHLARYYERYGRPAEQQRSVERAIDAFKAAPEQSSRRTAYRVDAYRRMASLLLREKEYLSAEENLVEGIRIYEDARKRRLLGRAAEFGRLYADLGDIEFYKSGDLEAAVRNYAEAELNGWAPPELRYRVGYAAYAREDWRGAAESFFKAAAELPLNRRILFSLGNALYRRGDLHAAQGYYNRLLDLLEAERSRFPTLLPNERPDHADLAERLMRARNNLGVALEDLAERTGDARYRSRALALYSESARAYDALTRDPKTMVRSESPNLAFLNTRGSLYPERRFEPQIYAEIDKDGLEPSAWEELLAE